MRGDGDDAAGGHPRGCGSYFGSRTYSVWTLRRLATRLRLFFTRWWISRWRSSFLGRARSRSFEGLFAFAEDGAEGEGRERCDGEEHLESEECAVLEDACPGVFAVAVHCEDIGEDSDQHIDP